MGIFVFSGSFFSLSNTSVAIHGVIDSKAFHLSFTSPIHMGLVGGGGKVSGRD